MLEMLTRRREEAQRRRDRADAAIPAAVLDGEEREIEDLRRERRDAAEEAGDLEGAIDLAAERERREREAAEAERRRGLMADAASLADGRTEAAKEVDGALAALEAAVIRHRDIGTVLSRALRAAGAGDDRIAPHGEPGPEVGGVARRPGGGRADAGAEGASAQAAVAGRAAGGVGARD